MADFKPVLKAILRVEGLYVWDEDDSGGETWQGVARNKSPRWKGWPIIDAYRKLNPRTSLGAKNGNKKELAVWNKILSADPQLQILVNEFYEAEYWDINRLDEFKDQQLAQNVADCGVNCGTGTASRMIQRAYNAAHFYDRPPLKVDGKIGTNTLWALNMGDTVKIYNAYNELRKAYYEVIIARKPSQAKYRRSWMSRIIPYKS